MKINIKGLLDYVAGFAVGAIMAAIIASWGNATVGNRIFFVVLLGLLIFASLPAKPKSYKSNSTPDGKPLHVLVSEGSNENGDNPSRLTGKDQSQRRKGNNPRDGTHILQ